MKIPKFCLLLALAAPQAGAVGLISLNFIGSPTSAQQQSFQDAAAYWNSVLTGYDLTTSYDQYYQPYTRPHQLTIDVSIAANDGVGGVLGSAGPTSAAYYDNNPSGTPTVALYYATAGSMQFDSADVDALITSNQFFGVVLHEMAHVIGFGTMWTSNHNLEGTDYPMYVTDSGQYLGANALAQYQTEFNQPGASYVPVELEGGAGTANGHWNEVANGLSATGLESVYGDMQNELMTGWLNNNLYISKTTLGAIDDLGYIVDYTKAGLVSAIPEAGLMGWGIAIAGLAWRRRRTV